MAFRPPHSFGPPSGFGAPPGPPGPPGPPPSGFGPPTSQNPSETTANTPSAGKPAVKFFSVAGGTPVPVQNMAAAPPMSIPGPPISNAPAVSMPGPPTSFPGPPGASPLASNAPMGFQQQPTYPTHAFDAPASVPGAEDLGNQRQSPLPLLSELDTTLKCSKTFMRTTVGKLVGSQAQASMSRIPIGVIVQPMANDDINSNSKVPLVDFDTTGIVRCKRCRSYINPYVVWHENGRRWKCNICGLSNETPTSYFSHLDNQGRRRDRDQRPELNSCSVEFIAPNDYQVRPPQPPVCMFMIDVSSIAIASGMITVAANAIKAVLDELPGTPRTLVGFVTYDTSVHYFNLKSSLKLPQMLVISDLSEASQLPIPEDLLVNLQDSRHVVDNLLDALPQMFSKPIDDPNVNAAGSCFGSALLAARNVMEVYGGKLMVFSVSFPTLGEGCLKVRENPRLLGTDKEHLMLNSEDT